jgi:photosystem I reaction center subunit XII
MEVFFQLASLAFVLTIGPAVIILLAARKGNLLFLPMNINDSQVLVALFVALCTGILAFRLGAEIYELFSINTHSKSKENCCF